MRLKQLFDAADTDRSGALDSRELGRLVKRVMPEATSAQLNYLLVRQGGWVAVGGTGGGNGGTRTWLIS